MADLLPLEAVCLMASELLCAGVVPPGSGSHVELTKQLPEPDLPAGIFPQSCCNSISVNIYWQSTPEQMLWEEGSGRTNRTCLQKTDNLVGIQVTCIEEKWERVNRAWCFVFALVMGLGGAGYPAGHFRVSIHMKLPCPHHTRRITILTAWISCKG